MSKSPIPVLAAPADAPKAEAKAEVEPTTTAKADAPKAEAEVEAGAEALVASTTTPVPADADADAPKAETLANTAAKIEEVCVVPCHVSLYHSYSLSHSLTYLVIVLSLSRSPLSRLLSSNLLKFLPIALHYTM